MNFINHLYDIFIDGNGYLLLLKGLGVTLQVAFFACLLGIILGLIAAIMKLTESSKGRKTIFSVIANIYIDIIRGTPTVVQLLIIYFLVFRSQAGVLAGICTFGINSGAYVAEIIRAGIMAVDKGQMEAGRSLGLSYGTTMKEIIIPQAVKNILPALGNELIVLVKETAILGYVGIMDLAKASDFIISRKYVMFEPLIAIAIMYYLVIKIMTFALNAFERRLRQSDIR